MVEREKEALANNQDKANDQGTQTVNATRAEQSQPSPAPSVRRYGADDIARRAYERFVERGGGHGHDMDDWFEAERELQERSFSETATPPHGDELLPAPEQAPGRPRTALPKGKGPNRAKKGPPPVRTDRAADQ
jgi:hypothetical protein